MIATWGEARLLCRGAATGSWQTPNGLAWQARGGGLWVSRGEAVHHADLRAEGLAWRDDRVLAWSAAGAARELRGGHWQPPEPWRWRGLDVRLGRDAGGWTSPDLHLPDGARDSRWIRPFPVGVGALWVGRGWLYRLVEGARPRAVDDLRRDDVVVVGPHGAFAVGREGHYTRAAAPGRTPRPLAMPLERPRWSGDGTALAEAPEGTDLAEDLRGGAWALADGLLAGPGGRIWDLARGEPTVDEPCLDEGAIARIPGGWASVDLAGHLARVDDGGAREAWARLPLAPGDAPDRAWWHEDALRITTIAGDRWRVGRDGAVCEGSRRHRPPKPPPLPEGVAARGRTLTWRGRTWPLAAAGAASSEVGLVVWTEGGLVVHLPG